MVGVDVRGTDDELAESAQAAVGSLARDLYLPSGVRATSASPATIFRTSRRRSSCRPTSSTDRNTDRNR